MSVTVHLDGKACEARPDETILDVARREGLGERVPTLCFDPRLPPNGSCFLCIVDVEGAPRLLPACATPVRDGMKVALRNEKVERARKTALDLLLSNHDADCEGPCREGCPAGIDIQGYLKLVAEERYVEAWRLIRERNPLVSVCGRVCVRKCEDVCRRELFEGPVGINNLKRIASDYVRENPVVDPPGPDNGKKVAIVGAGPAGLTAAYYLRKQGTAVTLFERFPESGGMLRYGIPSYRLPREVLDAEVATITAMGAEIRYGVRIGQDVALTDLRAQYDAVFVGAGSHRSNKMRVEGEDGPGVLHGIDVLREFGLGQMPPFEGKKVVVVGGGNTAIDVARTAVRLDARETRIVYRRTRAEMPAHGDEIDAALDEGVSVDYLVAPVRCVHEGEGDARKLVGLACVRMELGEPDQSGRRRPVPIQGSEHVIPCDWVVAAIGQSSDLKGLVDGDGLPRANKWGDLEADPFTGATSEPGVFAAGDAVTGPQAVIDAIGAGRKAAFAIQRYLDLGEAAAPALQAGPAVLAEPVRFTSKRFGAVTRESIEATTDIAGGAREKVPHLPAEERKGFREVEFAIPQDAAVREQARCLLCGCAAIEECDLRRYATEYGADPTPYLGDSPRRRVDTRHPWLTIDPNKCILCGRCVRTCTDVLGVSALGLIGRGFETIVAPALNHPLLDAGCVTCGSCVEACPTGTLTFAGIDSGRWQPTAKTLTTCGFCGVGCPIEARRHGGKVTVRSEHGDYGVFSDLCVRGRFGHAVFGDEGRLTAPWVRRGGALVQATWDEAIEAAAAGLRDVRDRHGAGALAVTASPRVPCEDAWAAATLAREALGTGNAASLELAMHRPSADPLRAVFGGTYSTIDAEGVAAADVVLLVGTDPSELRPVAALAVRRAVSRGAKLVVLGSGHSPLTDLAAVWLNARRGTATLALAGLAAAVADAAGWPVRDGVQAFQDALALVTPEQLRSQVGVGEAECLAAADLLRTPGARVAVVADLDEPLERAPDHLVALADLILLLEHAHGGQRPGLLLLGAHANATGVRLAGLDAEDTLRRALDLGNIRGALLVGEDPANAAQLPDLTGSLRFLVVLDHTLTETARRADVVFPLASHLEAGGTFVSASGVARALGVLSAPPGGRTAADVLLGIAARLGWKSDVPDRAAITEKMADRGVVPGQRLPAPTADARFAVPSLAVRPTHAAPPTLLASERRAADRILMALGRRGPRA